MAEAALEWSLTDEGIKTFDDPEEVLTFIRHNIGMLRVNSVRLKHFLEALAEVETQMQVSCQRAAAADRVRNFESGAREEERTAESHKKAAAILRILLPR